MISSLLGYLVIIGSASAKLSQLYKVIQTRSVEGLSIKQLLVEEFCFLINIFYNYAHGYPFSTWGEVVFLWAQNMLLLFLLSRRTFRFYCGASLLEIVVIGLLWMSYRPLVTWLQIVTIVIRLFSLVPDNSRSDRNCFLSFLGALVRVFTLLGVNDLVILLGALMPLIANGIILFQVVVYPKRSHSLPAQSVQTAMEQLRKLRLSPSSKVSVEYNDGHTVEIYDSNV